MAKVMLREVRWVVSFILQKKRYGRNNRRNRV